MHLPAHPVPFRPLSGLQETPVATREESGVLGFLQSLSCVQLFATPWLEGVPGLPGAPQDEAGLTRKFETSHVGGGAAREAP